MVKAYSPMIQAITVIIAEGTFSFFFKIFE
jgi:hypothetical protein